MSITNWLPILSLVISVVALLLNYFSLRYLRQRVLLEQRKYENLQAEMASRRFDITVKETIKEGFPRFKPLSMWAAKIIVTNRTSEPILLNGLVVELNFQQWPKPARSLLRQFIFPSAESGWSLFFEIYKTGLTETGWLEVQPVGDISSWCVLIPMSTYLVNWETKQPILFDKRHWHRGPAAGEKEIWMLFGRIPADLSEQLSEHNLHLAAVRLQFYTDSGTVTTSGSFAIGQTVSEDFKAELDQLAQNFR